jgi:NADH-quinone oxidoreductase subunit N
VSVAQLYALLPILILALGATAILMVGAWWPARRPLPLAGIALALAAALAAGGCVPSLTEVAGLYGTGPYARFFAVLWSLVAALTLLLSLRYAAERDFPGGEYVSLVLFAAAGMALLSAATSLIGIFLGLETFTLALYILIAFHKTGSGGAEAGLKYLILGAVATGFLAFGIALIYVTAGTFHLPEALGAVADGGGLRPVALLGWGMLLVAIGFKVSLVPFHLWTPDVYQGAPAPVTGLLSSGSKGAVFAALVTLFAGFSGRGELAPLLWTLAAVTMLVGTFCALPQQNVKRMLAYSSVVHMGYVLLGLLAGGADGNSAVVFYLVAYSVVSIGAFGVVASFSAGGEEPQEYADWRGLGYRHPFRAGALAVFLFSLAGIPPTAGFIGKLGIFYAAVRADYLGLTLLAIFASLVSLYYYLRLVIVMFMSDQTAPDLSPGGSHEYAALAVCLSAVLVLGIFPGPLLDLIRTILP